MVAETKFIQSILPENYSTEMRFNGVFCYCKNSDGMSDEKFDIIRQLTRVKFDKRLIEISHTELLPKDFIKTHMQFTIYLRP